MPLLIGLLALLLSHTLSHAATATLAWDASPKATAYHLYYGTTSRSYYAVLKTGAVTQVTVPDLEPGTRYYFAVTAVNASGESARSAEVSVTTPQTSVSVLPHVAITAPSDGAQVPRGQYLTTRMTVTHPTPITVVRVFVNGTQRCGDRSAPYSCRWRTPTASGQTARIRVEAWDAAGNVGTSETITITTQ